MCDIFIMYKPPPPPPPAAAAAIYTYPRAAAAAAATAALLLLRRRSNIALKFHPKHEKQQNLRQNEIHYENITH
jgi:hypothetical protein